VLFSKCPFRVFKLYSNAVFELQLSKHVLDQTSLKTQTLAIHNIAYIGQALIHFDPVLELPVAAGKTVN
jgi:hypothetical protein